jgi:hypothetical protein
MRIEHMVFWTEDLERLAAFYIESVILDPDGIEVTS